MRKEQKYALIMSCINGLQLVVVAGLVGLVFGCSSIIGAKCMIEHTSKDIREVMEVSTVKNQACNGEELSANERSRVKFPQVYKTFHYVDHEDDSANEKPRLDVTPEQRKQLEDYVREYEEELEKAGKSSPKTRYTEA